MTATEASRDKWRIGIRTRVLAIALIPSTLLLATGGVTIAVLGTRAHAVREWSNYQQSVIDPLLHFVTAVEEERTAAMLVAGGVPASAVDLPGRRKALDAAMSETGEIASRASQFDPETARKFGAAIEQLVAKLGDIRHAVDTHATAPEAVDAFYTLLVGATADGGSDSAVGHSPDNDTLAGDMTGNALIRAVDTQARALDYAAVAQSRGGLDSAGRRALAELTGSYRQQLDTVAPRLAPSPQAGLRALTESNAWRLVDRAQNELSEHGSPDTPEDSWWAARKSVGDRLIAVVADQYRHTVALTQSVADNTLRWAVLAGTGLVIATVLAVAAALVLAGRLVRRLRSLRSSSLELANNRLPAIIARIHDGESVDVQEETTPVDTGADEIGEVADAFAAAQRTAIAAAVAEARTRDGFNRVFLDIAFRSQALVRRQLDVLDVAEAKQDHPDHLDLLFQLDHLATRARRNAENLLILGDRQPGRQWRRPVGLEEIVRSAASETEGFARVTAVRLPPVNVLGAAVADLIHLLAELIENAANFSPPDAPITVHGSIVGRGVVVEIVDRGLGMVFEQLEQVNALLVEPPEFHEMALTGRRQLGLFVVGRLARRHGIGVSLRESPYGGVTAIVLVPAAVLDRVSLDVAPADQAALEPSRTPLPRRVRPSNAMPPARRHIGSAASSAAERRRTPDVARAAMTSFQRGTRQARSSAGNSSQQNPDEQ
ncbi:nitrate- and nitrite sensing domain-containing protein [Nocardia elegans]|uniref:sensor histidine kinase n=1 Tax=Nocardia elegans TaxID=300029 RepID=UPI0018950B76|nr:ATP-binding protein [Nocardia elegans]MBF6245778.1 nitrate- and nitrite sensing domain-containing protein [Nocardia elegans]